METVAENSVAALNQRELCATVKIQSLFRRYACKGEYINAQRMKLAKQMRIWARGYTSKLIDHKDLQDIRSQALLLTAAAIAKAPSRPIRNLPSLIKVRLCQRALWEKQLEIQRPAELLRIEYDRRQKERELMRSEDRWARLWERLGEQLRKRAQEFTKRAEEKARMERSEERMRIQRLALMNTVQRMTADEIEQRIDKEMMFREEYTQRRLLQKRQHTFDSQLGADREMMVHEDLTGRVLRQNDKEEKRKAELIAIEREKARLAKLQGDIEIGEGGKKIGRSLKDRVRWRDKEKSKQQQQQLLLSQRQTIGDGDRMKVSNNPNAYILGRSRSSSSWRRPFVLRPLRVIIDKTDPSTSKYYRPETTRVAAERATIPIEKRTIPFFSLPPREEGAAAYDDEEDNDRDNNLNSSATTSSLPWWKKCETLSKPTQVELVNAFLEGVQKVSDFSGTEIKFIARVAFLAKVHAQQEKEEGRKKQAEKEKKGDTDIEPTAANIKDKQEQPKTRRKSSTASWASSEVSAAEAARTKTAAAAAFPVAFVSAKYRMHSRDRVHFQQLAVLRAIRMQRLLYQKKATFALATFESTHKQLTAIRDDLLKEKITTRTERLKKRTQAENLENTLPALRVEIIYYNRLVTDLLKREGLLTAELFDTVGFDEEGYADVHGGFSDESEVDDGEEENRVGDARTAAAASAGGSKVGGTPGTGASTGTASNSRSGEKGAAGGAGAQMRSKRSAQANAFKSAANSSRRSAEPKQGSSSAGGSTTRSSSATAGGAAVASRSLVTAKSSSPSRGTRNAAAVANAANATVAAAGGAAAGGSSTSSAAGASKGDVGTIKPTASTSFTIGGVGEEGSGTGTGTGDPLGVIAAGIKAATSAAVALSNHGNLGEHSASGAEQEDSKYDHGASSQMNDGVVSASVPASVSAGVKIMSMEELKARRATKKNAELSNVFWVLPADGLCVVSGEDPYEQTNTSASTSTATGTAGNPSAPLSAAGNPSAPLSAAGNPSAPPSASSVGGYSSKGNDGGNSEPLPDPAMKWKGPVLINRLRYMGHYPLAPPIETSKHHEKSIIEPPIPPTTTETSNPEDEFPRNLSPLLGIPTDLFSPGSSLVLGTTGTATTAARSQTKSGDKSRAAQKRGSVRGSVRVGSAETPSPSLSSASTPTLHSTTNHRHQSSLLLSKDRGSVSAGTSAQSSAKTSRENSPKGEDRKRRAQQQPPSPLLRPQQHSLNSKSKKGSAAASGKISSSYSKKTAKGNDDTDTSNAPAAVPLVPPSRSKTPVNGGKKKKEFDIPGQKFFLDKDSSKYDFIQWSKLMHRWTNDVCKWLRERQEAWRARRKSVCISYLQRIHWLLGDLHGASEDGSDPEIDLNRRGSTAMGAESTSRPSTAGTVGNNAQTKRPYLKDSDSHIAFVAHQADVYDLFELLLCRSGIKAKVFDPLTQKSFRLDLTVAQCDKLLGRHPASAIARCLLYQGRYNSNTITDNTAGLMKQSTSTTAPTTAGGLHISHTHSTVNSSAASSRAVSPDKRSVSGTNTAGAITARRTSAATSRAQTSARMRAQSPVKTAGTSRAASRTTSPLLRTDPTPNRSSRIGSTSRRPSPSISSPSPSPARGSVSVVTTITTTTKNGSSPSRSNSPSKQPSRSTSPSKTESPNKNKPESTDAATAVTAPEKPRVVPEAVPSFKTGFFVVIDALAKTDLQKLTAGPLENFAKKQKKSLLADLDNQLAASEITAGTGAGHEVTTSVNMSESIPVLNMSSSSSMSTSDGMKGNTKDASTTNPSTIDVCALKTTAAISDGSSLSTAPSTVRSETPQATGRSAAREAFDTVGRPQHISRSEPVDTRLKSSRASTVRSREDAYKIVQVEVKQQVMFEPPVVDTLTDPLLPRELSSLVFPGFGNQAALSAAAQDEIDQLKEIVSKLLQSDFLTDTDPAAALPYLVNANTARKLMSRGSKGKSGGSRRTSTRDDDRDLGTWRGGKFRVKPKTVKLYLHTDKTQPCTFISVDCSGDEWVSRIPRWMQPAYHWGETAVSWKRKHDLMVERNFTEAKHQRVDAAARKVLKVLHYRAMRMKARSRKLVEEYKHAVNQICMSWEDAAGAYARQKRMVEDESLRLKRFAEIEARKGLFYTCRICCGKANEAQIAPTIPDLITNQQKRIIQLRLPNQLPPVRMLYAASRGNDDAARKMLDHLATLAKPFFEGPFVYPVIDDHKINIPVARHRNVHLSKLGDYLERTVGALKTKNHWITGRPLRVRGSFEEGAGPRSKSSKGTLRTSVLLSSILFRGASASVKSAGGVSAGTGTGASFSITGGTQVSQLMKTPSGVRRAIQTAADAAADASTVTPGLTTSEGPTSTPVVIGGVGFNDATSRSQRYQPKYEEWWICGGSTDGCVIAATRVVEDETANPRGVLRVELLSTTDAYDSIAAADTLAAKVGRLVTIEENANDTSRSLRGGPAQVTETAATMTLRAAGVPDQLASGTIVANARTGFATAQMLCSHVREEYAHCCVVQLPVLVPGKPVPRPPIYKSPKKIRKIYSTIPGITASSSSRGTTGTTPPTLAANLSVSLSQSESSSAKSTPDSSPVRSRSSSIMRNVSTSSRAPTSKSLSKQQSHSSTVTTATGSTTPMRGIKSGNASVSISDHSYPASPSGGRRSKSVEESGIRSYRKKAFVQPLSETAVHRLGHHIAGLKVGIERGRELVPLPDISDFQRSMNTDFLIQRYSSPAAINAAITLQKIARMNYAIITISRIRMQRDLSHKEGDDEDAEDDDDD